MDIFRIHCKTAVHYIKMITVQIHYDLLFLGSLTSIISNDLINKCARKNVNC